MIKESKYIIRRIIIGVGIFIGISLVNKCSVSAYSSTDNFSTISKSNVLNDSNIILLDSFQDTLYFYKNKNNNNVYWCSSNSNTCYYMYFNNFTYNNIGLVFDLYNRVISNRSCAFLSSGGLPKYITANTQSNSSKGYYYSDTYLFCVWGNYNSSDFGISTRGFVSTSSTIQDSIYPPTIYFNSNNVKTSSNINWNYYLNLYTQNNFPIGNVPEFVSFNMTKRTNNNVILGYIFRPEFTDFNTTDYDYQYSFNGNGWLSLTENEQIVNINGNGIFSVRIKEKSTNDIIDSATFTITNIGTFNDNVDYNIKYSGEYRTDNFQNNQVSSNSSSIIESYQIYVDYFPKSSLLKYQYQYVKDGDSLSTWNDLVSSNNGSFTYTATDNGILYARILDSSNNVLYSSTFTVSTIGDLAFDNNTVVYNNLLDKLNNKINFTGPISSIIDIPIELIMTISSGLSGGLTCSDYSLGNLMGTNLVIPCVNVKQHLGNDLYSTIDLIIACCMIYHIIKMFGDIYTNLLFIEKNPIQYLGKRGD